MATKFTPEGEIQVRISVEADEKESARLRFEVIDSGVGVNPQKAAKLFEPFTQADESTTREFGGTGMDDYLSKPIKREALREMLTLWIGDRESNESAA